MTDGVCFITIQGQRMGCYELDDRAAQRSLLKQVYRACQATRPSFGSGLVLFCQRRRECG